MNGIMPGDRVRCTLERVDNDIVRTVTTAGMIGNQRVLGADGGDVCPHCKRAPDKATGLIHETWFIKVDDDKKEI